MALVLSCFDSACGEASPGPCVASLAAPLVHGRPVPEGVTLSAAQRAAIGGLHVGGNPACTATLIEPGWAITAAHCAFAAETFVASQDEQAVTLVIVDAVLHDELDVALLAVESHDGPVPTPIPLWGGPIDATWKGTRATLAGIGVTESGSTGELRFVDESIVRVTAHEIWVDGMGQSGACEGDSGGPLLVASERGQTWVAGVLDRGSRDCLGLDVYTRADVVRAWAGDLLGPLPPESCESNP